MKKLAIAMISLTLLQGCAVALVAGIGAGAASINDRRTLGAQVDDQSIEVKAHSLIAEVKELDEKTRVQVVSLNGTVLVVGQSPNKALRTQVINIISGIQGIRKVHNQIRIANKTSYGTRTNDSWLTTKVKTELLASDKIDGTAIKVVTEDSEVFLMGLVKANEANVAVDIVRHVNGVSRVYKAFQTM
ncbi:BON domain-containing protein [Thalassotalea nanhaiensis]|uniref:BON domain-containing protein n=1 Tax=Thalassotalea nanhaiensis TaxID=3065648 RepID=A0ABY9TH19_9GAMM|nr:BON domain-containing protein [Colwelliaceae bacterium SQ345]